MGGVSEAERAGKRSDPRFHWLAFSTNLSGQHAATDSIWEKKYFDVQEYKTRSGHCPL